MSTKKSRPNPAASAAAVPPNPNTPAEPVREGLDQTWATQYQGLYDGVTTALHAIADGFDADIEIAGMDATDLFGLNSALGSAIERHVVEALNKLRTVWDPTGKYPTFTLVRFPQSFPDVRLIDRNAVKTDPVLMGIELKGWFGLAKEGQPSFRFAATPLACAQQDLIVVVPWVFSNVLSGKPRLLTPFIEEARYVARMRNHHWTWVKGTGEPNDQVLLSIHSGPYPSKKTESSDKPVVDGGDNFGRIARTNVMDTFVATTLENDAGGIPIKYWVQFLNAFTERAAGTEEKIKTLFKQVREAMPDKDISGAKLNKLTGMLLEILKNDE